MGLSGRVEREEKSVGERAASPVLEKVEEKKLQVCYCGWQKIGVWVPEPHKAAPETVCVSCIISNFEWELGELVMDTP